MAGGDFSSLGAQHQIGINKDALEEDLKEAAADIEELRLTLEAKKREAAVLKEAAENGTPPP